MSEQPKKRRKGGLADLRPANKGPCEYHVCEFCGEIWDQHGRLEGRA